MFAQSCTPGTKNRVTNPCKTFTRVGHRPRSREDVLHDAGGFDAEEAEVEALKAVCQAFVIGSQQVHDCGLHVADGVFQSGQIH